MTRSTHHFYTLIDFYFDLNSYRIPGSYTEASIFQFRAFPTDDDASVSTHTHLHSFHSLKISFYPDPNIIHSILSFLYPQAHFFLSSSSSPLPPTDDIPFTLPMLLQMLKEILSYWSRNSIDNFTARNRFQERSRKIVFI